jgi:hypothetical protein
MESLINSEQELEKDMKKTIEERRHAIKTISHELCFQFDDKFATDCNILDQVNGLRDKLINLQMEKKKRIEEYQRFSEQEQELCDLLGMNTIDIISAVPKESEMNALKAYIKKLEKLKVS